MFFDSSTRCSRRMSSTAWALVVLQCFLLATATRAQTINEPGRKFLKPAPWDYSNVNNYTLNPTWLIGSTVHITWENVLLREYNITLLQQDPYEGGHGSNVADSPIYTKNATDKELGERGINWTVTDFGMDQEESSGIYYLALAGPEGPADLWTSLGIFSHYINFTTNKNDPAITDPPPGLASQSPSPNLNPYLTSSQRKAADGNDSGSNSDNSGNDGSNDKARNIGLGVGLGIGIPLLLLCLLAGWLALQLKRSRGAIKLQEENGFGAGGASPGATTGSTAGGWNNGAQGGYRQELGSEMEKKELPDDSMRRAEMGSDAKSGAGDTLGVPELPAGRGSALVEGQEHGAQGAGGLSPGDSQRSWSHSVRG